MTRGDYGGQRANMEDESMVGILRCQAEAIWPKERAILARRCGARWGRVLDLACGTGEVLRRVRSDFAPDLAVGLDLFAGHLRHAPPPVVVGDGYRTPFPERTFDVVLLRHLLQALPEPVAMLREARRVLRPGGRLHVLAEDYMGLVFDVEDYATANHFVTVAAPFRTAGTDLYQGRRSLRHLREAGFDDVVVDPFVVDNQADDREALAGVFAYWCEGYAATLAGLLGVAEDEVRRRFDLMVETVRDPARYAAWLLFAVNATR